MQQRSEETRQQILGAAYRLFSQVGYQAAGVAEICRAAGVSKGAFYHHFPSKQAVFLALLEYWLGGLDQAFEQVRSQTPEVPQAMQRMAQTAGSLLNAADARSSAAILLAFWLQAQSDPIVWQAAVAPYRRYHEYLTELISQGQAQGTLQGGSPQAAARAMIALALGTLMQALFDPQSAEWSQETQTSFDLLLRGLQTPDASHP